MIRPIICPNPVPGGGEHQVGGGSPTKLGLPQGEMAMRPESSNRSSSFFCFWTQLTLAGFNPFSKQLNLADVR